MTLYAITVADRQNIALLKMSSAAEMSTGTSLGVIMILLFAEESCWMIIVFTLFSINMRSLL